MKISLNWLKDYVQIKLKPQALAEKLTMAGIEVTALDNVGNDTVFEIEVTPNRPDCLSVIGIAREISTITGAKLKLPKVVLEKDNKSGELNFGLKVIDKKGCPRYIGRTIANVKVGPSPEWLKDKLEAIGVRCVNNIVDITNYVLLETAQPLHTFDFDKLIGGQIIVRRAKKAEKIITIDGQERILNPEILVIADSKRPVAIAGIMGGKDTEVTEETKNILLESAYFDSVLIRRASRFLGVSSESSYRFERGIDKNNVSVASMRAVNLINELAKSKLMQTKDYFTDEAKYKKTKIFLNTNNVNSLLGEDISTPQIVSILKDLGFSVSKKTATGLNVEVPSFREDVVIEADIIEEIARIYGYDNIPCSIPQAKIIEIEQEPLPKISHIISNTLIAQGFNEVITYGLLSQEQLQKVRLDTKDLTQIANPLSSEQELLRPTLLVGLLNCLAHNFNHNIDNIKIFEMGNVFEQTDEVITLGIAITGLKYNDWLRPVKDKLNIFDLKGVIEVILSKLGIDDFAFLKRDFAFLKKGTSAVLKIKDTEAGFLGEISDELLNQWDIKKRGIFIAEVNVNKICDFTNLKKVYQPMIDFPSINRDISLIVEEALSAEKIIKVIKEEGSAYLKNVVLIEQYIGEQIPAGFKGLVFSLEFQAQDRTLKDEEINSSHNHICEALKNKLNIKIR